jgi:hypothetical protein
MPRNRFVRSILSRRCVILSLAFAQRRCTVTHVPILLLSTRRDDPSTGGSSRSWWERLRSHMPSRTSNFSEQRTAPTSRTYAESSHPSARPSEPLSPATAASSASGQSGELTPMDLRIMEILREAEVQNLRTEFQTLCKLVHVPGTIITKEDWQGGGFQLTRDEWVTRFFKETASEKEGELSIPSCIGISTISYLLRSPWSSRHLLRDHRNRCGASKGNQEFWGCVTRLSQGQGLASKPAEELDINWPPFNLLSVLYTILSSHFLYFANIYTGPIHDPALSLTHDRPRYGDPEQMSIPKWVAYQPRRRSLQSRPSRRIASRYWIAKRRMPAPQQSPLLGPYRTSMRSRALQQTESM